MKDRVKAVVAAVLFCLLLTACGGEFETAGTGMDEREKKTASGQAVSGDAVSGQAVADRTVTDGNGDSKPASVSREQKVKFPFSNSTDFYVEKRKYDGAVMTIAQYTHDGKEVAKYNTGNGGASLLAVTDEGIYYSTDKGTPGAKLMRIPIHKGADGRDVMETENEEEILEDKDGILENSGLCIAGDNLYYISYGKYLPAVVQYNLGKKKEVSRFKLANQYLAIAEDKAADQSVPSIDFRMEILGRCGNRMFVSVSVSDTVENDDSSECIHILSRELEGGEWTEETETSDADVWALTEDAFFLSKENEDQPRAELVCMDKDGADRTLISDKEIRDLLVRENYIDNTGSIVEIYSRGIYPSGNKVYFMLQFWKIRKLVDVVLSFDFDSQKISLEKELEKKSGGGMVIYDGKAVYSEERDGDFGLMCYDIANGKTKKLTEKDPEFYMYTYVSWQNTSLGIYYD